MPTCTVPPDRSETQLPPPPLYSEIGYTYVGDRGETDEDGWALVWTATVEGDVSGEARWYFVEPNPIADLEVSNGSYAYYESRWQILVGGQVIMSGRSAGKTVTTADQDGVWDGHGVVTDASDAYRAYVGRPTYETGPVIFGDDPPQTMWGRGILAIQ
jgi:hypothetical protein